MVDYNMTPIDVWGSFGRGQEVGGALRQRQRERQYGQAFQQGGWGAVANAAGGQGDLQTAQGAQGVVAQQEEGAIQRAQRNATVLSNAATSLMGVPYEQRRERLQAMAPMLEQMGLDPQQVSQFDPTDEALASIRALQGQFSRYVDIRQQGNDLVGVTADDQVEVLHRGQPEAPTGHRWTQDGQGLERLPGYDPGELGSGGGGRGGVTYSPMTPEQAQAYGITNPADFAIGSNGLPRRVGGGGTFPAEQRARVAITYDAAHEAAQYMDRSEAQAVQRQGSHGSDTPIGQDWGAGIIDMIPGADALARGAGGRDYQQYTRASSSFESAMLPILSGAAVTESEARRIIRAALPQINDSRETLQAKSRQRQQMLNGAALIGGRPPPYPDLGVPSWAQAASTQNQDAPQSYGMPQAAINDGISPDEWDVMSPEEQALWQ